MPTIAVESSDFLDEMKLYFRGGWVQDPMVGLSISGVEMVTSGRGECQYQ